MIGEILERRQLDERERPGGEEEKDRRENRRQLTIGRAAEAK
jgi:hypothetical protein